MSAESKNADKTMKKQLVKWKGPKVDVGIGRRRELDSNVWINNDDDGEDNPDDWEDDTPDETDGWSSDNSENGTPGVEELVSENDDVDDYTYDSDELDFVDDVLRPDNLYFPDGTPRTHPVPKRRSTLDDILSTIPDDFEISVRAGNAGESKNDESKNSEEKSNVDTRPNRMRNLRLRF